MAILGNPSAYIRMSDVQVAELDGSYREQKRLALKAGHSHVQPSEPARTAESKMIGHVCG